MPAGPVCVHSRLPAEERRDRPGEKRGETGLARREERQAWQEERGDRPGEQYGMSQFFLLDALKKPTTHLTFPLQELPLLMVFGKQASRKSPAVGIF